MTGWWRAGGVIALLAADASAPAAQPEHPARAPAAATAAAPPPPTPAQIGKPLPIARFALERAFGTPVLSPDGTWVAARTIANGKPVITAFPVADLLAKGVTVEIGTAAVSKISWAGDRRLILTVRGQAVIYGIPLPVTRLLAFDLTTRRLQRLDERSRGLAGGDILYADPAGRWLIVASQNDLFSTPSVKRIDLDTGVVTEVERARPDVWSWFADAQGVVRAGIAYAGSRWTLWYRDTAEAPLRRIKGRKPEDEDGAVDGLRFAVEPGKAAIITNSRTGRFAAYRYDMTTGTVGAALFEHPEVDVDGVIVNGDGEVTGLSYEAERPGVHWLDPTMKRVQATLDRTLPHASNVVIGNSTDLNRLLVWSGSASDPGEYYLYDRKAKTMNGIAEPFDRTDVDRYAPVRPIRYTSRDGLVINGYLTLPRDRPERGLPLVMLPHGGPFARDSWSFDPYVQFLASRGYAVFQPNFRGSTGYGKAFVERGYGQWGQGMQDDVDDGLDWLVKQGIVDPKRVCIMGISYGGYAALWGAIRNPERYRCAVSLAGVTDLPGMLKYDRKAFAAPRYFRQWQRRVEGEEKRDLTALSPLAQAHRMTVPVLIAHGDDDTNVPAKQGRAMVKALEAARRPVVSVFYPGEGHGLDKSVNKIDFFTRLERFLAEHNPT